MLESPIFTLDYKFVSEDKPFFHAEHEIVPMHDMKILEALEIQLH